MNLHQFITADLYVLIHECSFFCGDIFGKKLSQTEAVVLLFDNKLRRSLNATECLFISMCGMVRTLGTISKIICHMQQHCLYFLAQLVT